MLPTSLNGEIEIMNEKGHINRFTRWEDDVLKDDDDGNVVEVIEGPLSILVTRPWSTDYFSKSTDFTAIKEQMADESCCLVEDALDTRFINTLSALPVSKRRVGPADVRCHREFSLHFLCKDTLIKYFEDITGLQLRDVKAVGREMQAGSYEILNDASDMQNTLYVILTTCQDDSLRVSGGVTRFLAADGEELVNYTPKHNTLFIVYASTDPIRVYTELVKDCTAPFRQIILRFTTSE